MTFRALIMALAVVASACSGSPTAPSLVPPSAVVTPRTLQSLKVVSASIRFADSTQFRAVARYSDNTETEVTNTATWSSSDSGLAVVEKGMVRIVSSIWRDIPFLIHAEFEGQKVSSPWVTMEANPDVPGTYIRLSLEGPKEMYRYEQKQLMVVAIWSNGVKRDVTPEIDRWAQVNITGPVTPYNVFASRNGVAKAEYVGVTKIMTAFIDENGLGRNAELIITVLPR